MAIYRLSLIRGQPAGCPLLLKGDIMKKLLSIHLCIILAIVTLILPVSADIHGGDTKDYSEVAAMQNGVTAYALSFAGDGEVKYVLGGYGGRLHPGGENDGYWSLEQVKQHHNEYREPHNQDEVSAYLAGNKICGCDCASFVSAVFQHFGLYKDSWGITCTTYANSADWHEITAEEARPGDIVLYWEKKKSNGTVIDEGWGHVELYIGGGMQVGIRRSIYSEGSPNYVSVMNVYSFDNANKSQYPHYFRAFEDESVLGAPASSVPEIEFQISSNFVEEGDLAGMVEDALFWQGSRRLVSADRDNLSDSEILNIEKIGNMKDAGKLTVEKVTGVAQTALGIIVLAYALILFAGFIFDRVNTVFEISLVTLFSFGYIKIARREDYEEVLRTNGVKAIEKGYMTVVKFLIIELVLVAIGSALLLGIIFYLIIKLLDWIGGIIK